MAAVGVAVGGSRWQLVAVGVGWCESPTKKKPWRLTLMLGLAVGGS